MSQTFVIVGAGRAAAAAAVTLRESGFDGRLVIIGDEVHLPYERPPLSKELLLGERTPENIVIKGRAWYDENKVEMMLGREVLSLDAEAHELVLDGDERVAYDKVLVATGVRPRLLPFAPPGERVCYLRTIEDANRLLGVIGSGGKLVVIGGGFIGCEVAACARRAGLDVIVLEALAQPLERVLGDEIGSIIAGFHRTEGVDVRTSQAVTGVTERADGVTVETTEGPIEAAAVVVGIGTATNTEFLDGSGLDVDGGIVVDDCCRTSVADVFAAGDVAKHWHPLFGRHMRVEHDDNASRQGAAAAKNMLGEEVAFDDCHWFWSDQYEHSIQSLGILDDSDQTVMRGSLESGEFTVFHLKEGRLTGVLSVNRGRDIMRSRKLLQGRVDLDADDLANDEVDLRKLAKKA